MSGGRCLTLKRGLLMCSALGLIFQVYPFWKCRIRSLNWGSPGRHVDGVGLIPISSKASGKQSALNLKESGVLE